VVIAELGRRLVISDSEPYTVSTQSQNQRR
jgi:hypothetical protein